MVGVAGQAARRLLVLQGDPVSAAAWLCRQLATRPLDELLWIADGGPPGIATVPAQRVAAQLGREFGLLVYNAHDGFHPDAFAAALGTLRGGGDCVLLTPPLDAWPDYPDPDKRRFACHPRRPEDMHGHFLARLVRLWRAHPACLSGDVETLPAPRLAPPRAARQQLTAAQRAAVAAVERVAHGHARRPLVLTADRGRGKSTVLGVAAAHLLCGGLSRITVVAAHRAAVETLFAQARAAAGVPPGAVGDLDIAGGRLQFRLPAQCEGLTADDAGLILVDEAAVIPVAVLARLLELGNRLVFSTTVHGYEGSGRGFEIRFRALLERRMPQWRGLRLEQPVRWAADDPLEDLLNASFLLDAEIAEGGGTAPPTIASVDGATLAGDEALLRAVFGLLINAHYQTRPSDLRQLLDNPDVMLWLARRGSAVTGVLLAAFEGGLAAPLADAILAGRRRPRGHLLPQSLAVHGGLDGALEQRVLRVQRIAVQPQRRRQGIGRALLEALAGWGRVQGFDLLGCAYGAEPGLLAFWQAAGLQAVRLGARVDPASAAHSLFMLRGLSDRGQALAELGGRRFRAQLPWALGGSLGDLDSRLAAALLAGRDCTDVALDDLDRQDLARVAAGARQPATAEAPIGKALLCMAARRTAALSELAPLVAWQLQHRPVAQVCREFALAGRRGLVEHLRALLKAHAKTLRSTC